MQTIRSCNVPRVQGTTLANANLSPARWPEDERVRAESLQAQSWCPPADRAVSTCDGIISAIASPIAVQAGLAALRQGGTAADAAATVVLTQIATELGSVVSYAGIMTLLYHEAKTGQTYSMDAGFNSYRHETDPLSIPSNDFGVPLPGAPAPTPGGADGRKTLVPGLMAGVEGMHGRFGRLSFAQLFAPAVWYADQGIIINDKLEKYFALRQKYLARTPEGQQFLHQAGNELPRAGELFRQPALAATLREVARHGSQYMYTGEWASAFVKAVRNAGGAATLDDMLRYQPLWTEPNSTSVFDHHVHMGGWPNKTVYQVGTGLNLAEALKTDKRGAYWTDPFAFRDLAHIERVTTGAPAISADIADFLRGKGVDVSPQGQRTKAYATAVAPLLEHVCASAAGRNATRDPRHSNSVVVVDKEGNVAALTHTINTVAWGDTGIVVGGVPLPDAAGFQQAALAAIQPGDRLPNEIADTVVCNADGKPVLATASIGSSLTPETIRVILGVTGQRLDLKTVLSAPPLLANFGSRSAAAPAQIPADSYTADFVTRLSTIGMETQAIPGPAAASLRGTVAAVSIDATTNRKHAVEVASVLVFNGSE